MKAEKAWMIATFVFAAGFFILLGNYMGAKDAPTLPTPTPTAPTPAKAPAPTPAAEPKAPEIVDLGDVKGQIMGNPDGEITIVEFSDFECPFCARATPTVDQIMEKYDNVKLIYKHYPLPFHSNAKPAAMASECAGDQGKFREYHDKLFENQKALDDASLKGYAEELGLDTEKFKECLDSKKYEKKVDEDMALGQKSGVSGTPTFFINGRKLVGAQPAAAFEQILDSI